MSAADSVKSALFVGNSHTYQPKELGGVPGALSRLAAACGHTLSTESVTQGGADLADLWAEFQSFVQRSKDGASWDTVVLQVGKGSDEHSRFAIVEVLRHRYAPLLLQMPSPRVVLYQTWSTPWPGASEGEELTASLEEYRAALVSAGIKEVSVAKAGHAFLHLRSLDSRVYPALWKDDMGHGSALAGTLVAMVLAMTLGITQGERAGRMLEAMLPSAWRTASPGFAGATDFGQKAWREESKGAPAAVMSLLQDADEDLPLSKYPPGMRTERRDLPFQFGELLVASAASVQVSGPTASPEEPMKCSPGGYATEPVKARRWQKR
ncbi:unnamed protein product [Effrenium voratum]|uniref:Uncharacterized protein n=1 Tax=Effrenium voratum TaxID=2562239 RepID=A0AA36NB27_9DINO|nr:unnamed protein product [Effrenium voratum]CAJ1429860.1 unnamed protein product [Effrenium voratum]